MSVNISLFAGIGAQLFDNSGNVLTGGKIFTYAAGTTTPEPTYTTSTGTIPHTNPIILDASGRVPSGGEIWLTDAIGYKFTVTTSTQQLILNIAEEITTGTRITVVKRIGKFWEDTSSTSLVTSTGTQAVFIRSRPTKLPDIYFYGGEKVLLENSIAITDENGEPLEGY
jgi:hypothetical protein